jgi:predicted nucleotide-binding protein
MMFDRIFRRCTQRKDCVFLLHGRNMEATQAMTEFLKDLGLRVVTWSEAMRNTKGASPYLGEILRTGFAMSHVAVVLMTPDEIVCLRHKFRKPEDSIDDTGPVRQVRPNVLFELGWAIGGYEDRTIIVTLGKQRIMSDIRGRHFMSFDGSPSSRSELAGALKKADCSVDVSRAQWGTAGDFRRILEEEVSYKGPEALIPAGIVARSEQVWMRELLDTRAEVLLIGHNFADQLGKRPEEPSLLHRTIVKGLKDSNAVVTMIFAPPSLLQAAHPIGFRDLMNNALPRMLDLKRTDDLSSSEKERLRIVCHSGALSLSGMIRDPTDSLHGLIMITPRWVTDTQGSRRMYCMVHKADYPELFDALYLPLYSDLRITARDIEDVAREYRIN